MKKILKKYGGTHVLVIDANDRKIERLEEGDVINIEITERLGNINEAKLE